MESDITNSFLWKSLEKDSCDFETSLDFFKKKQTGCYFTSLKLTYAIMEDLVINMTKEDKSTIYKKKFLEPCVGTGNFVFAYLAVCKDLNLTKENYIELINNIYVCDINTEALSLYKKNLKYFVKENFNIELDDKYFSSHLADGLLIDITSINTNNINYISLDKIFDKKIIGTGFDIIATNPPYKNLKAEKKHYKTIEEYENAKVNYAQIANISKQHFKYSTNGTLNLYKLFVEKIIDEYSSPQAIISLLIPASILNDKTSSNLRKFIMSSSNIKSIRLIPENNNYTNASQALCAINLQKGDLTKKIFINGSFNGNINKGITIPASYIYESNIENAILILSERNYQIRQKMLENPLIKNIPYIHNFRGELDLSIDKKYITSLPTPYKLLRGRHLGYYKFNTNKINEYVHSDFLETSLKSNYVKTDRIACQQIVNISKKRRISFSFIPKNYILANSSNFISLSQNSDNIDLFFLLGLFNSTLINWYFKTTSSNNHVNNYEIDNFPIPINYSHKNLISKNVQIYYKTNNPSILEEIEKLVYEAYQLDSFFERGAYIE